MSGGHYDYKCFEVGNFAEMVLMDVHACSERREVRYSPEYVEVREPLPNSLLDKMQVFCDVMRACAGMARDIEWLMSGDTSEEYTEKTLHDGLTNIGKMVDSYHAQV